MIVLTDITLGKKVKFIKENGGSSEVYNKIKDSSGVKSVLFTGFCDVKGNEIFEGDVLTCIQSNLPNVLATCAYCDGGFFLVIQGNLKLGIVDCLKNWVVVGNCWEDEGVLLNRAGKEVKKTGFV